MMSHSNPIVHLIVKTYGILNRTPLFRNPWVKKAYIASYFTYKKHIEDPFYHLFRNCPYLFEGGHILDIGANIGYTSYIFSKAIQSDYLVFAFEPEDENFMDLKKTVKNYRLENRVIPIQASVGATSGAVQLWRNLAHRGDHRILTDALIQLDPQVNLNTQFSSMISLDDFVLQRIPNEKIAMIKIDVQGYELSVCQGMNRLLQDHQNINVIFEYHPAGISSLGFQPEDLLNFFHQKDFLFYQIEKSGQLIPIDLKAIRQQVEKSDFNFYLNILCSRKAYDGEVKRTF